MPCTNCSQCWTWSPSVPMRRRRPRCGCCPGTSWPPAIAMAPTSRPSAKQKIGPQELGNERPQKRTETERLCEKCWFQHFQCQILWPPFAWGRMCIRKPCDGPGARGKSRQPGVTFVFFGFGEPLVQEKWCHEKSCFSSFGSGKPRTHKKDLSRIISDFRMTFGNCDSSPCESDHFLGAAWHFQALLFSFCPEIICLQEVGRCCQLLVAV